MPDTKKVNKLRTSLRIKILIVLSAIVLIVMMFPKGESIESEVTVGSIWIKDDLIASTTFEILKTKNFYEKELDQAASKVEPVFLKDNSVAKISIDSIKNHNSHLLKSLNNISLSNSNNNISYISDQSYQTLLQLKKRSKSFPGLKIYSIKELLNRSLITLENIYQQGFLDHTYREINKDSIAIRDGKYERIFIKTIFLDRNTVNNFIANQLDINVGTNKEINEALTEYIIYHTKPNLIYSNELTELAIEAAKEKIPRNVGIVNEDERIIAKHDRITAEAKLKIDSYRIARGEEIGFWGRFAQNLGKFLHVTIILLLFSLYIYLFRKRIYGDNLKILLVVTIILLICFITYLIYSINVSTPIEYLVLVPVASMLLTIIFDSRIGFYGTVVIALIVGGLRGNDYVFALTNIVTGGLAAYTVRDIKNRSQIFRSFVFILIGYGLSIIAFGLERFDSLEQMLVSFAFAASNALLSPVFTFGLIIFIEKIFKITTDLTLLELSDFNQPLLKELASNAPGTFNHSVVIGTMVETAAEKIGANTILARVGAYYHDIGKSVDPSSFVENQIKTKNIHESLKPEKSANLILNHVKKGIELAEEGGLPQEIIDFIPMHHGTQVITFFYEKAKELYGEENVEIDNYRYPGPKPNTRETALVMLADTCESAVRSLDDPQTEIVENVINNLINARISDGQLNNSPLTFSDITKIKESFLNILISQHHKRIKYPNQEEVESSKDNQ